MHCGPLQMAVLNAGSRVFARDDKKGGNSTGHSCFIGLDQKYGCDTRKKSRSERAAIIDAIGPEIP